MFRLTLLGAPGIVGANDVLLTGRPTQRHRLALLALLALAPPTGISRDKLLAYLWPERDTEHGRNLLKQAVHALRSALGDSAISSAGDDLQLNTDLVVVDVKEYESALALPDHEAAVSLYRGPFLDGFFLNEAPEFERWANHERQRLADAYARALEALAEAAEAKRDFASAVANWKARAAHDPYDSRVAQRLMQALEASGTPAGALRHASIHAQLLQKEFGAEPPHEIKALAERIRDQPNGAVVASAEGLPVEAISSRLATAAQQTVASATEAVQRARVLTTSRRPLWYGIIAVVLVVVLFGAVWLRSGSIDNSTTGTVRPSIAVLPLTNLSADPRDAALAGGITEELISMLASTGDVRVIASTSAAAFRDRQIDVRGIADSLRVSNVLEGSVQKLGTSLRVKVRLVDGHDGSTRWSQAYDREFSGVLSVQDDIARAVAGELGLRFDKDRQLTRHKATNAAAYELYLRASDPLLLRSQSGIWKAQEYFQQAITTDSTYAAAHAGLALVYVRRARTASDPGMPVPKLLALAEYEATTAVALDDSLAEAHYALGVVREAILDIRSAATEITRAIVLDPSRSVYRRRLSYIQGWEGRPDQELAEAQRALEIDPLNPYAHAAVAGALFGNRRYDQALEQLQRIAAVQPPLQAVAFSVAQIYAKKQMWQEAISLLRPQAEAGEPLYQALLGYMLARAGQREEAHQVIADLTARPGFRALQVAVVYVGLGDLDQAFTWLNKSIDDQSISSWIMGPTFDELHRDPRFARLRGRLGLQQLPQLSSASSILPR